MIYRKYSLFSSTLLIWGGVATAGLAGIFILHGKEGSSQLGVLLLLQYLHTYALPTLQYFAQKEKGRIQLCTIGNIPDITKRKCREDVAFHCNILQEKFQEHLNRKGDSLRQQDRAMMANAKRD